MEQRKRERRLVITVRGFLDDPRSFAYAVETLREFIGAEVPAERVIEVTLSTAGADRHHCEMFTAHRRGTSLRVGVEGETTQAAITSAAKLLSAHLRATSNAA